MATTATLQVHPAADVFPLLSEPELTELVKDIAHHGLKEKITLWRGGDEPTAPLYLLDGRNRLEALKRSGRLDLDGLEPLDEYAVVLGLKEVPDPAAFVISKNIRRRHLSKGEQAKAIWQIAQAMKTTESANMAEPVRRDEHGRVQGSTKDPVKTSAIELAKPVDISERTMERHRPKDETARPRQVRAKAKTEMQPTRSVKVTVTPAGGEPRSVEVYPPIVEVSSPRVLVPRHDDMRTELQKLLEVSRDRWTQLKPGRVLSTIAAKDAALRRRDELVEWMLGELARLAVSR